MDMVILPFMSSQSSVIPTSLVRDHPFKLKVCDCVGGVISPLLANMYLHPLDRQMKQKGYRMVRYADDFVVLCRSAEQAQAALDEVRAWVEPERA